MKPEDQPEEEKEETEEEIAARQRAVDEIIALKARHKSDLKYVFENRGKNISTAFATATPESPPAPPGSYRIELLAREVSANGDSTITDTKGRELPATATTRKQGRENRIILITKVSDERG